MTEIKKSSREEAIDNLQGLVVLLPVYIGMLEIEHPDAKLQLAVIAKNPDGGGNVGPSWDLGSFLEDLMLVVGSGKPSMEKEDLPPEIPEVPRTPLSAEDMEAIDAIVRWRSSASDWYGEELVGLVSDYIYEEDGPHSPESNLASYEAALKDQEGLTQEHLALLRRGLEIMRELPEAEKWQAVMDSLKRIEHY